MAIDRDTGVARPAPAARAQRLLPAALATFMSAFVALVVTAINTGIDSHLPWRWLRARAIAWPAAVLAAYLFKPIAWRPALILARIAAGERAREPRRQRRSDTA